MDDLVSIIMPSYNTDQYIKNTIKSVLTQTYQNWELLIVDDCSTDNTDKIVAEFDDKRIKYFKNEKNCGAAISRNKALREAKGKWIAFLDSDDIWHPEKLERQLAFMKKNGYAFTYTDYRTQLNGEWVPYINTAPNVINRKKIYDYCYIPILTVIYDAEIIGLIQIENLKKNNDYAIWLKAIERSNAYRLPECLSYYIRHDGSVSSGNKLKLIKCHYLLFRKGCEKNCIVSVFLTLNNLFHGIIKKIRYKEFVSKIPTIFSTEE